MHQKPILIYTFTVMVVIAVVGVTGIYIHNKSTVTQSGINSPDTIQLLQLPSSTPQGSSLPSPSTHKLLVSTRHRVSFEYPAQWYYESDIPEHAMGDWEEYHFFLQGTQANWSEAEDPGNEVMLVFIMSDDNSHNVKPDHMINGNKFYNPVYGSPYDTNAITTNNTLVTFRIREGAKPYKDFLFSTLKSEH